MPTQYWDKYVMKLARASRTLKFLIEDMSSHPVIRQNNRLRHRVNAVLSFEFLRQVRPCLIRRIVQKIVGAVTVVQCSFASAFMGTVRYYLPHDDNCEWEDDKQENEPCRREEFETLRTAIRTVNTDFFSSKTYFTTAQYR